MNKRSGDDYGNRMFMISNPLNYTAEHTTEWDGFWRRGDDYGNRMFIISNTPYKMARTSQRNGLF